MSKDAAATKLEDRLQSLREQRSDGVQIEELESVVASLISGTSPAEESQSIAEELRELLDFVRGAQNELVTMQPKSLSQRDIPDAAKELDAVVDATENAASAIMNAADEIGELASEFGGDHSMTLMDISTRLFEASSFQDLTGQRISKVAKTLTHLEERLSVLADAIGDDYVKPSEEEAVERDDAGQVVHDEDLLHGPQMEGEGNSQAEIDALLASFD